MALGLEQLIAGLQSKLQSETETFLAFPLLRVHNRCQDMPLAIRMSVGPEISRRWPTGKPTSLYDVVLAIVLSASMGPQDLPVIGPLLNPSPVMLGYAHSEENEWGFRTGGSPAAQFRARWRRKSRHRTRGGRRKTWWPFPT